ncbi:MAG: putative dehydrogenase [Arenicella sp.]|jgi:predicted dehydrogenase
MLKIGLFGVGHLGRIHAKLILELKDQFEFVGFYDPDDENASKAVKSFGIKRFEDQNDLLNSIDCVDVVTPTLNHFEIAKNAIQLGKHTFLEKPMTNLVNESQELLDLANQNDIKIQVGHVERFNPAFKSARPFLLNPLFIEVHRLAQYNPRGTDVPVILDLMIHDLDAILSVVDSRVSNISASGVAVVSETPDIANARIEFENGCVANLTASRISMKNMRKTRFFQKDAYISVDYLEKKSEIVKMTTISHEPDPFDIVFDLGPGKEKKKIEVVQPTTQDTNAILEELKAFGEAITNNQTPIVSGEQGHYALEIAYRIIDKIKLNQNLLKQNI